MAESRSSSSSSSSSSSAWLALFKILDGNGAYFCVDSHAYRFGDAELESLEYGKPSSFGSFEELVKSSARGSASRGPELVE